jgi:putative transposase
MSIEEYLKKVIDIREYKRAQAVKLSEEGLSRAAIAAALSVSEAFVSKWRSRYSKDGTAGLGLAHQGSQGFLSQADKEKVLAWLDQQPPPVKTETLASHLDSEYGVKYQSKQSYYDLLNQAGMSYKKRQAVNPKKDEQQMLQKREEIKKK